MKRSGETLAILTPTILAYGVAAWCLAALTWDGAGYVFNTLQSGAPVISHHRFTNWPSLAAVAAAGSLTDNARALGVLYGGLVSLTPLLSLALGLHFLREPRLRPLRSWLVLGILWGALFLGERVSAGMIGACVTILVGTALATGFVGRLRGIGTRQGGAAAKQ